MSVCCGGIVGMGESRRQRAGLIGRLANLTPYPESVPINHLVPVPGTPLAEQPGLDPFEFVRTIAIARITMPKARVRMSAGRQERGRAVQESRCCRGQRTAGPPSRQVSSPSPA